MDMSETYGTTGTGNYDATRELGSVEVVAKDEARATAEQAKDGAGHIAAVGKDEAMNVAQETGHQAKDLWQQTRNQLLDQSAEQQTRVAEGLRSLSQELSGMARGSEQQGVASDLAQQASQRVGDVAGWLDERDPGSLVTEVKRFARQRPGAFLATAAVLGLVGGRLSRGLVDDHQDSSPDGGTGSPDRPSADAARTGTSSSVDHSTTGYAVPSSTTSTWVPAADRPAMEPMTDAGSSEAVSTGGPVAGEYPR